MANLERWVRLNDHKKWKTRYGFIANPLWFWMFALIFLEYGGKDAGL